MTSRAIWGAAARRSPATPGRTESLRWKTHERWLRFSTTALLLASFSYSFTLPTAYLRGEVGFAQIVFRMVPMLSAAIILFRADARRGFVALSNTIRWPAVALVWYVAMSVIGGITSLLPILALWKAFEVLVVVYWSCLIYAYVQDWEIRRRLLEWSMLVLFSVLVWVMLSGVVRPSAVFDPIKSPMPFQINSFFPIINPNSLAVMAVVILYSIFCGVIFSHSGLWRVLGFLVAVFVFVVAQSRTVFIGAAVVFVVGVAESVRHFSRRNLLILAVGCIATAAAIASVQFLADLLLFRGLDSMHELSGRLNIWQPLDLMVSQRPVFGGGLGTGSRLLPILEPSLFTGRFKAGLVGSVHNSYWEALLSAGFVGAIPLFILYSIVAARAGYEFVKSPTPILFTQKGFWIGVLIILAMRSITSSGLALYGIDLVILGLILATKQVSNGG